jgi:hypothetical protein
MADTIAEARQPETYADGPSSPSLHSRLTLNASKRRTSEEDEDAQSDLSDSELFEELERELEEEGERGGVVGRLREERMKELKRQ